MTIGVLLEYSPSIRSQRRSQRRRRIQVVLNRLGVQVQVASVVDWAEGKESTKQGNKHVKRG